MDRAELERALFALGDHVRYVAFGVGQDIHTAQRGDLDCGGLSHVIVGYGNFTQVVVPAEAGHVSVCIEREADAEQAARDIRRLLDTYTT